MWVESGSGCLENLSPGDETGDKVHPETGFVIKLGWATVTQLPQGLQLYLKCPGLAFPLRF